MRIVVTGAAGFIGSHLCDALVAAGHSVVGIDGFVPTYPRAVKEANLGSLAGAGRFELHHADLRHADLAPLLDGADVVVNEAAVPGLGRSWVDFDLYASCNLGAVDKLARAAVDVRVGLVVQASTSSVYGAEAVGDESMLPRPVSPYGVTKLAAEHLLHSYGAAAGLPVVVLRYFSIYGPRQRPDMAYHRFIELLRRGRPVPVYGDGRQSRSITFVADCVDATMRAIEGAVPGETYNVGGGEPVTVLEAVGVLGDELGVEPRVEFQATPPGDQRHTRADTGKARRAFGYEPSVRPDEGLRRQVAWHLSCLPLDR